MCKNETRKAFFKALKEARRIVKERKESVQIQPFVSGQRYLSIPKSDKESGFFKITGYPNKVGFIVNVNFFNNGQITSRKVGVDPSEGKWVTLDPEKYKMEINENLFQNFYSEKWPKPCVIGYVG